MWFQFLDLSFMLNVKFTVSVSASWTDPLHGILGCLDCSILSPRKSFWHKHLKYFYSSGSSTEINYAFLSVALSGWKWFLVRLIHPDCEQSNNLTKAWDVMPQDWTLRQRKISHVVKPSTQNTTWWSKRPWSTIWNVWILYKMPAWKCDQ